MLNKCIIICGQTATGKSDLAVSIALHLKKHSIQSEIISADSRQVYKGFDITSAKITTAEMYSVHHHMLSIADPNKDYTVADYKKQVKKIITKLHKNNTIPIICGGTGLYIDNVVFNNTLPEVEPNIKLRNKLEKLTETELLNLLKKSDSVRAQNIDSKNKRRLVRALEIIEELGKVPELGDINLVYDTLCIGLTIPKENLKDRIKKRTNKRMQKNAMLFEIENLHKSGLSYERLESFGMEYKWLSLYAQNKIKKLECIDGINTDTIKYTKRQMTWFKKNKLIKWLDMSKPKTATNEATKIALDFLTGKIY